MSTTAPIIYSDELYLDLREVVFASLTPTGLQVIFKGNSNPVMLELNKEDSLNILKSITNRVLHVSSVQSSM